MAATVYFAMGSGYNAISASYVVFKAAHSRWIMAGSHPLDDSLPEDAVGANHQREDHQDVRCEVLGAAAHVGIDVAGGDVLHDADDEPADDGPRDRIETAEDHDREDLEADQRQAHVDAQHVPPQDTAQGRDDAR